MKICSVDYNKLFGDMGYKNVGKFTWFKEVRETNYILTINALGYWTTKSFVIKIRVHNEHINIVRNYTRLRFNTDIIEVCKQIEELYTNEEFKNAFGVINERDIK